MNSTGVDNVMWGPAYGDDILFSSGFVRFFSAVVDVIGPKSNQTFAQFRRRMVDEWHFTFFGVVRRYIRTVVGVVVANSKSVKATGI